MLLNKPEKIVLGCTHYPYLIAELAKYANEECFIDPAEIFVDFIKQDLQECGLLNSKTSQGTEEFFVSANPEAFVENAKLFYDLKIKPLVF